VLKIKEFHGDFKRVKKMVTNCTKKFLLLLMYIKFVLLLTFYGAFFQRSFNIFETSIKFCVFDTFQIKNFCKVILALFAKFEANPHEWLQISKKGFCR
jgi:hypothetical protein